MPHKLESKSRQAGPNEFGREFFRGFSTPFRAVKMIFDHPRLISLSLFPIFMTLLVAALCIYGVLTGAWYIGNHWFQAVLGNYAGVATGLLAFVIGIFSVYLLFHSIGILLSFIASPFNDWLAEETERASGAKPQPLTFAVFFRVFLLDLRKTILTLSVSIGLWFLTFIPGAGILSAVGFALVTTLTFISYPQSRRQLGVIECLGWMKAHFFASLGFGFATMILFGLPVLNAFSLPVSVVGGTLLFLGETKKIGESAV
jgi:CysZ protein